MMGWRRRAQGVTVRTAMEVGIASSLVGKTTYKVGANAVCIPWLGAMDEV